MIRLGLEGAADFRGSAMGGKRRFSARGVPSLTKAELEIGRV